MSQELAQVSARALLHESRVSRSKCQLYFRSQELAEVSAKALLQESRVSRSECMYCSLCGKAER
eukprot:2955316-Amphidinium_carterae.1